MSIIRDERSSWRSFKIRKLRHKNPTRRSDRKTSVELAYEQDLKINFQLRKNHDRGLGLSKRRIPGKGRGIITTRNRRRGEFVVEYAGEVINMESARERENEYSMDVNNGCFMYFFKYNGKQFCVDATKESGRLGRLVNHSCKRPNLVTKVATMDGGPRLVLVANQDIDKGTELLFDYGDRDKESIKNHPWLAT